MSFSNIAWEADEDDAAAEVMRRHGIQAVDIAPGRYFDDVTAASDRAIVEVRTRWQDRGFAVTGMQSLLFGTQGLNVFADEPTRRRMLDYLGHVLRIGAGLGAGALVFGSPRNRDRNGLDDERVAELSSSFFRELGRRAADEGVIVTLEPNPPAYGANFMTTSSETAAVVRRVDHPAIRMQLDLGACAMNDEHVADVIGDHADVIAHVHLSEPGLVPVGDGGTDHGLAAPVVTAELAHLVACIEMRRPDGEPAVGAIERAAAFVTSRYGEVSQ